MPPKPNSQKPKPKAHPAVIRIRRRQTLMKNATPNFDRSRGGVLQTLPFNVNAVASQLSAYFRDSGNGIYHGREILMDVVGTGTNEISVASLNPSTWADSRLSRVAAAFLNFEYRSFRYIYAPAVGTVRDGQLTMGVLQAENFTPTARSIASTPGSSVNPVWGTSSNWCNILPLQRWRKFNLKVQPNNAPIFVVQKEGTPVGLLGRVWIEYTIQFTGSAVQPSFANTVVTKLRDLDKYPPGVGYITGMTPEAFTRLNTLLDYDHRFSSRFDFIGPLLSVGKMIVSTIGIDGIMNIVTSGVSFLLNKIFDRTDNSDDTEVTLFYQKATIDPYSNGGGGGGGGGGAPLPPISLPPQVFYGDSFIQSTRRTGTPLDSITFPYGETYAKVVKLSGDSGGVQWFEVHVALVTFSTGWNTGTVAYYTLGPNHANIYNNYFHLFLSRFPNLSVRITQNTMLLLQSNIAANDWDVPIEDQIAMASALVFMEMTSHLVCVLGLSPLLTILHIALSSKKLIGIPYQSQLTEMESTSFFLLTNKHSTL